MLHYLDTTTIYVLAGGLGIAVLGLILRQVKSLQTSVPVWLVASIIGCLVGTGASLASMHGLGYHWDNEELAENAGGGETSMMASGGMGGGGGGMGMGGGGGGMGGGGGGMGGGGGGMGGGGGGMGMGGGGMGGGMGGGGRRGPSPKDSLSDFVWKIEVATSPKFELDETQRASVAKLLGELKEQEQLSDEAAEEKLETIKEILQQAQLDYLESFSKPRRRGGRGGRGGGGRPGGGGGGGGGSAAQARPPAEDYPQPEGETNPEPPADPNPFQDGDDAKTIGELLERLAS